MDYSMFPISFNQVYLYKENLQQMSSPYMLQEKQWLRCQIEFTQWYGDEDCCLICKSIWLRTNLYVELPLLSGHDLVSLVVWHLTTTKWHRCNFFHSRLTIKVSVCVWVSLHKSHYRLAIFSDYSRPIVIWHHIFVESDHPKVWKLLWLTYSVWHYI